MSEKARLDRMYQVMESARKEELEKNANGLKNIHFKKINDTLYEDNLRFKYPLLDGQQVRAPGWSAGARTWIVSRCTPISLMAVHPRVHLYIMYTPSRHPLDCL